MLTKKTFTKTALSSVAGGALVALLSLTAQAADTEPKWTVYVEEGESKVRNVELLPASTPLEHYTENLTLICPEMMNEKFDEPSPILTHPYDPNSVVVSEIGAWHDYIIYDVHNDLARHRSIVLKDGTGNHRILYTQSCWASIFDTNFPRILTVQGYNVLAYRSHTGGTGFWHLEYYFVFDPETRLPVRLSLDPIEAKLKEILPEGKAVWKGGGFDIATLTYDHSVWQKGDGNCCPSAGRVSMKLEIRDYALVVTEALYDPKNIPK